MSPTVLWVDHPDLPPSPERPRMATSKATARKLATQAEWTLLEASFAPELKALTPARLKQKITRARKLQDKYRDRARQQKGEMRGKRTPTGTRAAKGNVSTVAKQELFTEARERFEAQLDKLEAKVAKEAASAAAKAEKAAAKAAKHAASGRTTGADTQATNTARRAVSKASRGARKATALTRSNSKAHQAHVGARGRRRQARRDAQ